MGGNMESVKFSTTEFDVTINKKSSEERFISKGGVFDHELFDVMKNMRDEIMRFNQQSNFLIDEGDYLCNNKIDFGWDGLVTLFIVLLVVILLPCVCLLLIGFLILIFVFIVIFCSPLIFAISGFLIFLNFHYLKFDIFDYKKTE
jgi:hypothetical protein